MKCASCASNICSFFRNIWLSPVFALWSAMYTLTFLNTSFNRGYITQRATLHIIYRMFQNLRVKTRKENCRKIKQQKFSLRFLIPTVLEILWFKAIAELNLVCEQSSALRIKKLQRNLIFRNFPTLCHFDSQISRHIRGKINTQCAIN